MPEKNIHLTAFLCHASEDKPQVKKLYQRLVDDGIDIWFDEERLLPGQNWELEISRALRSAHAIIVCLSNRSVTKEGFVQKEIKKAFALAEEKPDGAIFIIPVRLEDFLMPERFSAIQYVDIHQAGGYEKLIASLAKRAESLGLVLRKKKEPDHSLDIDHELTVMLKMMMRGGAELQEELQHLSRREPGGEGWLHQRIRDELLSIMSSPSQPAAERTQAGDVLAAVGDPRFRTDAWFLPDDDLLGFVEIPAGTFQMGIPLTRENAAKRDSPQHPVNLPTCFIGRFPVTVTQYHAYLRDISPQVTPEVKEIGNHPVVDITWHDAMLYCQWLTEKLRRWPGTPKEVAALLGEQAEGSSWIISLPSEAQWEKAARGTADERVYPWGSTPDPNRANYENTHLGRISPVGCFEEGGSPYGVQEMSGNVCEWTRTNWGFDIGMPKFRYPYDPLDGREDSKYSNLLKVHRGGSFYDLAADIRCSSRGAADPNVPYGHIGFRLALTPLTWR